MKRLGTDMLRHAVSVILLPCLVLTQSALFGHSHGGKAQPGHDLRPHIHATKPAAPHDHHNPGGDHHHDDVGDDDEPEHATAEPTNPKPSPDHDDDAVYLEVDITTELGQTTEDTLRVFSWQLLPLNLTSGGVVGWPDCSTPRPHPSPHSVASDCPLYVRHLTLLI
mgnify:CR=1 FL=1